MTSKIIGLIIVSCFLLAKCEAKPDGVIDDYLMHPPPVISQQVDKHVAVNLDEEITAKYWNNIGAQIVKERLAVKPNEGVAKNVILFLGDGMSVPTVSATRVYKGKKEGKDENTVLSFEKFPYTALSKTYCVDSQVADSACTSTAYLCGIKANRATIGVTAKVKYGECESMVDKKNHIKSIGYYSQKKGKSTGFVTKSKVTDASPAGLYSHTSTRFWETDTAIEKAGKDPKICTDIATQLIDWEEGNNLNVIMGGGRTNFLPENITDVENNTGIRHDGVNLIEKWQKYRTDAKQNGVYVWNREGLLKDVTDKTDYVLGLFRSEDMLYNLDRNPEESPSLAEMTAAAIKVLSKNKNGYFLFVEGALIDKAHHSSKAQKAIDDTVEFAEAIELAVNMTSESDTLIVVTADHAHTLSYSGYASRGHNIFGIAGEDAEHAPYTILSYANGPGHVADAKKDKLVEDKLDKDYRYRSTVDLGSETHGGDDVAIYARGPWAHLFSGVLEQHAIPHIMSYASCVGEGEDSACKHKLPQHNGAQHFTSPMIISLLSVMSYSTLC